LRVLSSGYLHTNTDLPFNLHPCRYDLKSRELSEEKERVSDLKRDKSDLTQRLMSSKVLGVPATASPTEMAKEVAMRDSLAKVMEAEVRTNQGRKPASRTALY
jgi:hypothetical protein